MAKPRPAARLWGRHTLPDTPACAAHRLQEVGPLRLPTPAALTRSACSFDPDTLDLLEKLLVCNPRERLSATQALEHDYFYSEPMPASLGK
jgi:serine/threonine protein kinase